MDVGQYKKYVCLDLSQYSSYTKSLTTKEIYFWRSNRVAPKMFRPAMGPS
jgi:hypothetical protein